MNAKLPSAGVLTTFPTQETGGLVLLPSFRGIDDLTSLISLRDGITGDNPSLGPRHPRIRRH